MKRILSIIVTAIILCSAVPMIAAAKSDCACGKSPVIVLPGYSGTYLYLNPESEDRVQVWPASIDGTAALSIADIFASVIPKLIVDANGNADKVVEKFGEFFALFEKMYMKPDGTPKHNVDSLRGHAREFRWDAMLAAGKEKLNNQRPITNSFLDEVPADHVYLFATDWRRSQADSCVRLKEFIEQVKEDSGHDKVSLFGVSYGGQLAASYFTLYGGEGIDRAVLHAPAVRGSSLTVDLLENEDFAFDPPSLLDILMVYLGVESAVYQRLSGLAMAQVSDIAVRVFRAYLTPLALGFGSFWDIVPPAEYERLKEKYLDPEESAELIRKADWIHNEMMPNIGETLRRVQAQGVKLAVIAGSGLPLASGNRTNSDYIIDVESTTGAVALGLDAAPLPAETWNLHRSPDGRIDAGEAYLPDHTWFFKGQYHGQAAWDPYAKALYNKWLFTDDIQDVYSDPRYPQFRDSCHAATGLEARFSGSVGGYRCAEDETLLLTNLSDFEISLLSVTARGADLEVPIVNSVVIGPHKTVRLRCEGGLPAKTTYFTLEAEYIRESPLPSNETRSFDFTAMPAGGVVPAALVYDDTQPAAPVRVRPVQLLIVVLALAASLGLAAFAVRVIYKRKMS